MSDMVGEAIIEKVKQAHYFSLMVDSTPDMFHQGQMSLVIRYLDVEDYDIKESLLGMFIIAKTDAYHYAGLVLKNAEVLRLNFTLCRGQTNDNAARMSDHLSVL